RRSKLVRLTRKGDARYRELNARFLVIASAMGDELSEADIRETAEIVRRLSDEAKGALGATGAEHGAGEIGTGCRTGARDAQACDACPSTFCYPIDGDTYFRSTTQYCVS